MMTTSQARKAINDKIKAFAGLPQSKIQWSNQPKFAPPTIGVWSRVTIQYADSVQAGLYQGLLERDFGIINIQCFERKGAGDVALTDLAEAWREHFKGWSYQFIEVTQTNAPTATIDELSTDFISTLVRIDFRVN
ncbi:MAG: phage tail terminator-like protein [Acinetobacter sp.]